MKMILVASSSNVGYEIRWTQFHYFNAGMMQLMRDSEVQTEALNDSPKKTWETIRMIMTILVGERNVSTLVSDGKTCFNYM